jgi:Glycosyl hydrolase family 76
MRRVGDASPDGLHGPPAPCPLARAPRRRLEAAVAGLLLVITVALVATGCADSSTSSSTAPSQPPLSASPTPTILPPPVAAARAAAALRSFNAAFLRSGAGRGPHFTTSTAGGYADFWRQAEMTEMVEDAYDGTHDPQYAGLVVQLEAQTLTAYGTSWLNRPWNDDIMWGVLAALRAYQISGDAQYLTVARSNYDAAYARGWSRTFGGGIWWSTAQTQKPVTSTAPAVIAACMLYKDTRAASYLGQAKSMYAWMRATLYDTNTGAVYDHVSSGPGGKGVRVDKAQLTYNQGSFIGAADALYRITGQRSYFDDALRTLTHTQASLTTGGILQSEATVRHRDGGGFKGIFARYAVRFVREYGLTRFEPWFAANAAAAWSARNARGLIGQDWTVPTPNSALLFAWDCSAAVVLLEAVAAR